MTKQCQYNRVHGDGHANKPTRQCTKVGFHVLHTHPEGIAVTVCGTHKRMTVRRTQRGNPPTWWFTNLLDFFDDKVMYDAKDVVSQHYDTTQIV